MEISPASPTIQLDSSPCSRTDAPHAALSPSLRTLQNRHSAFEMKCLVGQDVATAIETAISAYMAPDPHHDAKGGYTLSTIYFDSPELDVFRRRGRFKLLKFRARRYGDGDEVFLERKLKKGQLVRKRRVSAGLVSMQDGVEPTTPASVRNYRCLVERFRMAPVCVLRYRRTAYFGTCSDGPLRLTFDRRVVGRLASEWSFEGEGEEIDVMGDDQVVCELKYQDRLPAPFKALLHEFRLLPQGVSKYRRCMERFGIASRQGGQDA